MLLSAGPTAPRLSAGTAGAAVLSTGVLAAAGGGVWHCWAAGDRIELPPPTHHHHHHADYNRQLFRLGLGTLTVVLGAELSHTTFPKDTLDTQRFRY